MSLYHGYVKIQIVLSFTTHDLFEILDNRFITNVYNFVFLYVHTSYRRCEWEKIQYLAPSNVNYEIKCIN